MDAYAPEIERKMKRLFDSLSEDDRRRYAAVEATKLGHGGIKYIAQLLQCDPKTIQRGLAELDEPADLDTSRVRKKGGGRKKLIEVCAALEENFLKVLEDHTAGDPMRADVKWTNLSRGEIASRVTELGTPASRHVFPGMVQQRPFSGNTRDPSADPDRSRVGTGLRESLVAVQGFQFRENRVYPN